MKKDKHGRWPGGGESLADVETRSVSALKEILETYADCTAQ